MPNETMKLRPPLHFNEKQRDGEIGAEEAMRVAYCKGGRTGQAALAFSRGCVALVLAHSWIPFHQGNWKIIYSFWCICSSGVSFRF